jgi:hypothetical protein
MFDCPDDFAIAPAIAGIATDRTMRLLKRGEPPIEAPSGGRLDSSAGQSASMNGN